MSEPHLNHAGILTSNIYSVIQQVFIVTFMPSDTDKNKVSALLELTLDQTTVVQMMQDITMIFT